MSSNRSASRRHRLGVGPAAVAAVAAVAVALPAGAAARQPVAVPSPDAAEAVVAEAKQALAGDPQGMGEAPAADPTLALNAVATALPELEGRERRLATALLARPNDLDGDPFGNYPAAALAAVKSAASQNFCVFWVDDPAFPDAPDLADSDSDGVPDYVEAMLAIAEQTRATEVAPGPLGWSPPKPDRAGCGADPSRRADIYLRQIGDQGLFGYEVADPNQGRNRKRHGYIVMDDDYTPQEYPNFAEPLDAARVTFAHEFNHLLQQNVNSFVDPWMFESTATWAEEHVYPGIDDYVNFVRAFARFPGQPVTKVVPDTSDPRARKIYGAAVWNHWLATGGGGYGVDAVRRAWELADVGKLKDFALGAYDRTIDAFGGRGFAREFLAFTAATAEWRTGLGGFPDADRYPDVARKGKLGRAAKRFKLDHTAARFFDVPTRGGIVRLRVAGGRGLKAGIALVGRTADGVKVKTKLLNRRGRAKVKLGPARAFERITAVIVNADVRVRGFAITDWAYRKDNQRFRARLG